MKLNLELAARLLAIFLGMWVVYMLFLKITGHSPAVDEIILGMLSFMAFWLVKLDSSVNKLAGRFYEQSRKFDSMAVDFKEHINKKNH